MGLIDLSNQNNPFYECFMHLYIRASGSVFKAVRTESELIRRRQMMHRSRFRTGQPAPADTGPARMRTGMPASRRAGPLLARTAITLAILGAAQAASAIELDVGNPDLKARWDNTIKYSLSGRVKSA